MSRAYEMTVTIAGFKPRLKDKIIDACNEEWTFEDDWFDSNGEITSYGESSLCGGESEDEFAKRLCKAIWKANRGGCRVEVRATYMENLPTEEYTFTASQYRKPKKGEK
jgi:hypothetical protein